MRKFRNIWAFYQSLFLVNFGLSVAAGIFGGVANFAGCFLTFGFVASVAFKEVRGKSEYIFYRNNGLTRAQLWAFGFLLNIAVFLALISIFVLCKRMF
ncbi:hypothetical protein [Flavobacterium sp.]|uniref:hypothetical protein n=1 Tax=Flavobacterium sp. TaxID=239 RepID=UPI0011FD90C8|nr:hypothetical protein [Flavobacterium sp.]RZJ72470.1 MAG: hypothetical protein EOO49_06030 [Flavobacterium sp.]